MSVPDKSVEDWRRKIDEIDRRLVELLNERSRCVVENRPDQASIRRGALPTGSGEASARRCSKRESRPSSRRCDSTLV